MVLWLEWPWLVNAECYCTSLVLTNFAALIGTSWWIIVMAVFCFQKRKESLKETRQFRTNTWEFTMFMDKIEHRLIFSNMAPTFGGSILEDYCWWLSSWYGKWPFYLSADCFSIRNDYIFIEFAISTECSKQKKILETFGVEEGVRYPPCN